MSQRQCCPLPAASPSLCPPLWGRRAHGPGKCNCPPLKSESVPLRPSAAAPASHPLSRRCAFWPPSPPIFPRNCGRRLWLLIADPRWPTKKAASLALSTASLFAAALPGIFESFQSRTLAPCQAFSAPFPRYACPLCLGSVHRDPTTPFEGCFSTSNTRKKQHCLLWQRQPAHWLPTLCKVCCVWHAICYAPPLPAAPVPRRPPLVSFFPDFELRCPVMRQSIISAQNQHQKACVPAPRRIPIKTVALPSTTNRKFLLVVWSSRRPVLPASQCAVCVCVTCVAV